MTRLATCAISVALLCTANLLPAGVLYEQTMDATWLSNNATFFDATRPHGTTNLPNYIDFPAGSIAVGKLLEVPLIPAGLLDPSRTYTVDIAVQSTPVPGDSEFGVGVSDGSRFAGFLRSDNAGGSAYLDRGNDSGNSISSWGLTLVNTSAGNPTNYDVSVVLDSATETAVTGIYPTATHSGTVPIALDKTAGLSMVLHAGDATEQFQVESLGVRVSTPGHDPILHYSFDQRAIHGSTAVDTSGAGNDGTINGSPATNAGVFGEALHLGTGDFVDLGKALLSQTDANQPYTISAWVKSDAGAGGVILSQYPGTPYDARFGVTTYSNGGRPTWWHGGATQRDRIVASTDVNTDQQWHHVTFTKDAQQNLRVYVDGVNETPVGTSTHESAFSNADTRIGTFGAGYDFRGSIDEVWVFEEALRQSEIRNLQQFNSLEPVILHYSFDTVDIGGTANGSAITDRSGQQNHGTIAGSGISALTTGAPFGEALSFSGNSIVSVGKALLSTTDANQPYTIALWAKGSSGDGLFTQYLNSTDADRFGLRAGGGQGGRASWWSGGAFDLVGNTSVLDDVWHHIAFVKDDQQNLRVYIDGIDETPAGTFQHLDDFANQITEIGGFSQGSLGFNGAIDEVWVFAYALTPDEIHYLYAENMVPEPGTLILLALGCLGIIAGRRGRR